MIDNGQHKNKPVTHPKTSTPLYVVRYRRVVMLAIALFALLPSAVYAATLRDDGITDVHVVAFAKGLTMPDEVNVTGLLALPTGGEEIYYDEEDWDNWGDFVGSLFSFVIMGALIYWLPYKISNFRKKRAELANKERQAAQKAAQWRRQVNWVYVDGTTIYTATPGGLSISIDGGATFTNRTKEDGIGDNKRRTIPDEVNWVYRVYADGSTIYAATPGGLSISTDGGATFTNRTTKDGLGDDEVKGVYADGSTIYAATEGGLSISTDGGATFTNRTKEDGLGDNRVLGVYADGSTIYAATWPGLSISTDGGATFTNRTTEDGLASSWVKGVYADGSTVYAATWSGLSISTDGGVTFTNRTTEDGLGSNGVKGVYADGSTVYAATWRGLSISTDGGATFTTRTTKDGLGDNGVLGIYADGSTIYAATIGGLSISTDGGATFTNRTM